MDKRFLGILAAIVVIFAGIFAVSQHSSKNAATSTTGGTQPTNHQVGNGKSGVTLLEYGDFECPICQLYYTPLKQVSAQLSDQVYFQFRELPLSQIHPNAFAAARAAEAAGLQGKDKFWQMHDALYDSQSQWVPPVSNPQPVFDKFARNIGLDVAQFDKDYASTKVNDLVNADISAFSKTGQQMATPAFFLDGKYIDNSQFVDSSTGEPTAAKIVSVVNAEIAAKAKR